MTSFDSLPDLESYYAKGSNVGWKHIDRNEFPHTLHDLNGNPIAFGVAITTTIPRPALLSRRVLVGDLIPSSSWGSSLANLLTPKSWNELRQTVINRNQGVCEYCGDHVGKSLEVHEDWRYEMPTEVAEPGSEAFGRQTLAGFVGVCKACHACFHLGLANVKGHLAETLHRLTQINGWSDDQTDRYVSDVYERHEHLSTVNWYLDLRYAASLVSGVIVSSSWVRQEEDPRVLMRDNQRGYGLSIAVITGCPWRYPKEEAWTTLAVPD